MATYMLILSPLLLMALIISSATPATYPSTPRNQDLLVAIEEMQRANYFTFVVLINMAKTDLVQENITFLMPNDRALSKNMLRGNAVDDFLMRHSIPSPLLFDNLEYIPTGSTLPTLEPEFMLNISNNGRRSFYLNNVKLISPNICTAGSSIRCHGIDGVIQAINVKQQHNTTLPSPTCSNSTTPTAAGEPPAMAAPPVGGPAPLISPSPTETNNNSPQKSSSFQPQCYGGLLKVVTTCLMFFMFKLSI